MCTVLTAAVNLPGAEDGWTWAVDLVRAHARGHEVDAIGPFADLGALIARMHVVLAGDGVGEWTAAQCAELVASMHADLDEAIAVMDGEEGARLRARRGGLARIIDRARDVDSTPVIAIHGDLHIGQVLRSGQSLSIIDFDGNPLSSAEVRGAPAPAARDVAGMLASIDHVARVVNHRTENLDPRPALVWIAHAQDTFLASYQATLSEAGLRHLLDDRLLAPMMIDQECREYIYSARHLPHWRYVPDAVITHLLPEED
jgi:maltokinase